MRSPGECLALARLAPIALLVVVLLPRPGLAFEGFDTQAFKPPTDPDGYVIVEGSRALEGHIIDRLFRFLVGIPPPDEPQPIEVHASAYFNYARNPLTTSERGDRPTREIVEDLSQLDLVVGIGVLPRVQVGVVLPIVLNRDGFDFEDPSSEIREHGIGSLRVDMKVEVVRVREEEDVFGLAVKGFVQTPTGRERDFADNDHRVTGGFVLVPELRPAKFLRVALNIGYEYFDGQIEVGGTRVDDKVLLALGIGLDLAKLTGVTAIEGLEVVAEVTHFTRLCNPYDREEESPVELGGAIRFNRGLFLLVGGSAGLNEAIGAPDGRVFAAVGFTSRLFEGRP